MGMSTGEERVKNAALRSRIMTADDAAALIRPGMTVGTSGFTGVGYPQAVPQAIARRGTARDLTVICGASSGPELDGALTRAGLMTRRYPFQSNPESRDAINSGSICFSDMHLGHIHQAIYDGTFGRIDMAIIECCLVEEDGSVVPTFSVGISNVLMECADRVILEIDPSIPPALAGIHDIAGTGRLPSDVDLNIHGICDRIGTAAIPCDREKIAAIVISDGKKTSPRFTPADGVSQKIADNIIGALEEELRCGRLREGFSIQSGVGSVANAVLEGLLSSGIGGMNMYSEVIQDGALRLIEAGRIRQASSTSLSLSDEGKALLLEKLDFFKQHIVLRPQDISNSAQIIRKLGVVAMNTAVEIDIYGNVNSTHVMGSRMINGIGGSGDFARSSGLCIFITPSIAKGGTISCIVPMVTHVDNPEHDTQLIITEQGVADLRGKSPKERAAEVIERCSHPDYRPLLWDYFNRARELCGGAQTPHILSEAFALHERYQRYRDMRLDDTQAAGWCRAKGGN